MFIQFRRLNLLYVCIHIYTIKMVFEVQSYEVRKQSPAQCNCLNIIQGPNEKV